jgi:hypothetical protein
VCFESGGGGQAEKEVLLLSVWKVWINPSCEKKKEFFPLSPLSKAPPTTHQPPPPPQHHHTQNKQNVLNFKPSVVFPFLLFLFPKKESEREKKNTFERGKSKKLSFIFSLLSSLHLVKFL